MHTHISRNFYIEKIERSFRTHPIVGLLGPRQCGKTTLARSYAKNLERQGESLHLLDLEDPRSLLRLENPMLALEELKGLIIIDEMQRRPELFPILRVLVDQPTNERRFLVLGSASRDLIQQSSESLAGRIAYIELTPFNGREVQDLKRLWERGGFPKAYLAETFEDSLEWRKHYVTTFLERDIPNLGIRVSANVLRKFWMMLAHYHGCITNESEIGRSMGISRPTIEHYLDILSGTFMIRKLKPWFENMSKRQVKTPKVYFRDAGILHVLLGLADSSALYTNPKLGASWEGFALEEVIRYYDVTWEDAYFWGTHSGAELDLMIFKNGKKLGFEFKYADVACSTKSMRAAYASLKLDALTVIHPGEGSFPLSENIRSIGLKTFLYSSSPQ